MIHHTHCEFHLGDNLFQLHFLRKQAVAHPDDLFRHYTHEGYLVELREVVEDLPNISLYRLSQKPPESIDSWKNAGAGTPSGGFFENHRDRNDYYGFYLDWFARLSKQMGLDPVFTKREDLPFDYPRLRDSPGWHLSIPECEVLFVNSQPCSGQFPPMNSDDGSYLEDLIGELHTKHDLVLTQLSGRFPEVLCTKDYDLSASGIGHLSLRCHTVIMIGTGPAWPTMNKFNLENVKHRFVLLSPEHVSGFPNTVNVKDREELRGELVKAGIL